MRIRSFSLVGSGVALMLSSTTALAAEAPLTIKEPMVQTGSLSFSADWYADRVARFFREVGSDINASSFGTDRIHLFDSIQYFSHNCYGVSSTEQQECTALFGPYADLKVIHQNGTLMRILTESGYFRGGLSIPSALSNGTGTGSTVAPPSMGGGEMMPPTPVTPEPLSTEAEYRLRANRLWEICGNMFADAQNSCFQRNNRLVQKFGVSLDEFVR